MMFDISHVARRIHRLWLPDHDVQVNWLGSTSELYFLDYFESEPLIDGWVYPVGALQVAYAAVGISLVSMSTTHRYRL